MGSNFHCVTRSAKRSYARKHVAISSVPLLWGWRSKPTDIEPE
jgi:hypothetical protein